MSEGETLAVAGLMQTTIDTRRIALPFCHGTADALLKLKVR